MGNFDFVRQTLPSLHDDCARAESYLSSDPRSACVYAAAWTEQLVGLIYDVDSLPVPYQDDLRRGSTTRVPGQGAAGHHAEAEPDPRSPTRAVHESRQIRRERPSRCCASCNVVVWTSFRYSTDPAAVPRGQFDPTLAGKTHRCPARRW